MAGNIESLRERVGFQTAINAFLAGSESMHLAYRGVVRGLAQGIFANPDDLGPLSRAIEVARIEGVALGLQFGYGIEGVVSGMVENYVKVNPDELGQVRPGRQDSGVAGQNFGYHGGQDSALHGSDTLE